MIARLLIGTRTRRRALATVGTLLATAGLWAAFLRDAGDGGDGNADPGASVPAAVRELAAGLSAEQKVDALLLFGFDGTEATRPVSDLLRARQLGGVLVGARNWIDSAQGTALVAELRAAARDGGRIPPLIVAPQEGGTYRAFGDLPPEERELEIGDEASAALAERWARTTAESLRAAGFDMNLSPVADVATIASPIADRAFSDDPRIAALATAAVVRGCRAANLACVARHFPGLGAVSQDTDQGPGTVSLDQATLEARDLEAFRAAFEAGVPAVMLSHAFYAAFDPVTPASLSPEVATGLLRERFGFDGVAITDDLGAGAIKATYAVPEAAVAAISAGADMVLVESPADQEGVREALLGAVESGRIAPTRLDEAVARVLALKRRLGVVQ